jgi:hypothetical protein
MNGTHTLSEIEHVGDGYGFAMLSATGRPVAIFVYDSEAEARAAAHLVRSGMQRALGPDAPVPIRSYGLIGA